MKTLIQCPRLEDLEKLDKVQLEQMATVAELAIAKPYFLDRLKVALQLKGGL